MKKDSAETAVSHSHAHGPHRHELLLMPCAGVLCELHEYCARYAYIEGSREPSSRWLLTCLDPITNVRVAYIDVEQIGPPHIRHWAITRKSLRVPGNRRPHFGQEASNDYRHLLRVA